MSKYTEDTLTLWTKPVSFTEEEKLLNAERMVKEAIANSTVLKSKAIQIFGQGSYANDTNVKLNSDIDINVKYGNDFYFELPKNRNRNEFNIYTASTYTFGEYKDDVEAALVDKFGRKDVLRKDKCITIVENSYRVETDVVPTWEHRRYHENGSFTEGVEFKTESGKWTTSFPKQHLNNGKQKNSLTSKRFKKLTRIYKKLRYNMLDDNKAVSSNITSFLLECLVWNIPNNTFNSCSTWSALLRESIVYLYNETKEDSTCKDWGEVSELLYLFHHERRWSRQDVNDYMVLLWNYLQLK